MALLVLSGVVNALSILPVHAMTLRNPYFDLLLVKVGLAVVIVAWPRRTDGALLRRCRPAAREQCATLLSAWVSKRVLDSS